MASIKFIYRSKKSFAPLTLRLVHKKEVDVFINTGYLSKREFWFSSKNKQYPYPKGKCKNSIQDKNVLSKLENYIYNRFNKDYNNFVINKNWLQFEIDIFFKRKKKGENKIPEILIDYVSYYISKAPQLRNSKGGFGISKSRVDDFKILNKFLIEFIGGRIVKISDVDLKFRDEFVKWMNNEKRYANGYTGRMLGAIKTICNDAVFNGIQAHPQLAKICGYKVKNKYIIFLTPNELDKISKVSLKSEKLKNARKWLLLGCSIGQRGSDLLQLTEENISVRNKLEVIELKQQKTAKQVTIPILNDVKEIIQDGFPYNISLQKFNDSIKEVCRLSGLKELTKGTIYNKETKRREYGEYEKWKLISSHVCRRSFCSNNFGLINNLLIMSVTGHQSEKTFLGYIGKTSYDMAQQFKDAYEKNNIKE